MAPMLAKVPGANRRCEGYLSGEGYIVSRCMGYLVALSAPASYRESCAKWRLEALLILPEQWQYQVSVSTRKQFMILCKHMNGEDVKSLVCATDAGSERADFRIVYH